MKNKTRKIVIMGMISAVMLIMAYTPLGYLSIGPLAVTFNMIPVALAAILLGPVGGLTAGCIFGITSFLQCIGIGGTSAMGAVLFEISPFLSFVQRFVPRAVDGLLLGYIFRGAKRLTGNYAACTITGLCAAVINTVLFMGALVLIFGKTEYVSSIMDGRGFIAFIAAFAGVNAIAEAVISAIITGMVGNALLRYIET